MRRLRDRFLNRLRSRLRDWLGIQTLESDQIATALELAAKVREQAAVNDHFATHFNDLAGVVGFQQDVLKRWSSQSETLRTIEAKHRRKQDGSTIISLPSVVGGQQ